MLRYAKRYQAFSRSSQRCDDLTKARKAGEPMPPMITLASGRCTFESRPMPNTLGTDHQEGIELRFGLFRNVLLPMSRPCTISNWSVHKLKLRHLGIDSSARDQLRMRSLIHNAPFIKHNNTICFFHRSQAVRNN